MAERHFYRCLACLEVQAVDGAQLPSVWNPELRRDQVALCDCGGELAWMGRVRGLSLVQSHLGCPCDARCTHATGPNCDCSCGGKHHGTGRLVEMVTDLGPVPVLKPRADLEERRARVAEFVAAKTTAISRIDAATHGALSAARAGRWIAPADFNAKQELEHQYRKARKYLNHKRRIAALNAIAQPVAEAA